MTEKIAIDATSESDTRHCENTVRTGNFMRRRFRRDSGFASRKLEGVEGRGSRVGSRSVPVDCSRCGVPKFFSREGHEGDEGKKVGKLLARRSEKIVTFETLRRLRVLRATCRLKPGLRTARRFRSSTSTPLGTGGTLAVCESYCRTFRASARGGAEGVCRLHRRRRSGPRCDATARGGV